MGLLETNILGFLRTGQGDFEALALALFARQFEKNRPYRAYCGAQNLSPDTVKRWQDIPAVPVTAFKSTELATFPVGQAAAIFESSGTTREVKSRHYFKTLTFYETSLKWSFRKWVLGPVPGQAPFLILTPAPGEAARSSLSWMMDVVKRTYSAPNSAYFVERGRLDDRRLSRYLDEAAATQTPVVLLGTTIAFLGFMEIAARTGKRYRLPAGSRLMDTGGMKTETRSVTRAEFVRQVEAVFGIPETACINEYGMCEMSSQFYGVGSAHYLQGPPWVRTLVIDPATGQEAAPGQSGLLRHFDLANVDSILAIQTEDVGVAEGEGFQLLGRDPHAGVKGCSLSAEAFLA